MDKTLIRKAKLAAMGDVCRAITGNERKYKIGDMIDVVRQNSITLTDPIELPMDGTKVIVPNGFEILGFINLCAMGITDCPDCGGTGAIQTKTTCPTCGGSGLMMVNITCPGCGGSGQVMVQNACPSCGGSGEVDGQPCQACNGTGYEDQQIPCDTCGGLGQSTEYQTCDKCWGSGSVVSESNACARCEGTGTIYALKDRPTVFGHMWIMDYPLAFTTIGVSNDKAYLYFTAFDPNTSSSGFVCVLVSEIAEGEIGMQIAEAKMNGESVMETMAQAGVKAELRLPRFLFIDGCFLL